MDVNFFDVLRNQAPRAGRMRGEAPALAPPHFVAPQSRGKPRSFEAPCEAGNG